MRAPAGEVADDPDTLRVRGPHGERHTAVARLRAEDRPQSLVPSLADQVQIQLAEGGWVPVRVVEWAAVDLYQVVQHGPGYPRLEDALRVHPGGRVAGTVHQNRDVGGAPAQRADDRPAGERVRAEDRVRIAGRAGDQVVHAPSREVPSNRAIDWRGIHDQLGRCRASYAAS